MQINSENLTRKQARAVAALLAHRTIEDAARAVGVNPRTIYAWLDLAAFRAALNQAESAVIRDALRAVVGDLQSNFETMRAIRDGDAPETVKLQAAKALDASLLRWRELETLEERITRLEERINSNERK
ncbi:MAG TPA: helix-turn-helix domain-containing protein [Anaerolineales bacterium]|nr:helix-turn-helix domain-containing protein [Anaerolineales bacterium]